MPAAASPSRPVIASVFAIVLLSAMVWTDGNDGYAVAINAMQPERGSDEVIVTLPPAALRGMDTESPGNTPPEASPAPPAQSNILTPDPIASWAGEDVLRPTPLNLVTVGRAGVNPRSSNKAASKFAAEYRSLRKLVAVLGLQHIQDDDDATFVGKASTYNPYREKRDESHGQTASGEPYDSGAWTAAIQIGLRERFGGIRYGRLYQPVFALIDNGNKRAIVKINDVGPLKAGRLIDLNERSMRYFDPFLRHGLMSETRITLLPGNDWTPGPLGSAELISFASAQ